MSLCDEVTISYNSPPALPLICIVFTQSPGAHSLARLVHSGHYHTKKSTNHFVILLLPHPPTSCHFLLLPPVSPLARVLSAGCGQAGVRLHHTVPVGGGRLPIGEAVPLLEPGQLGRVPGVPGVEFLLVVVGGVDATLAAAAAHCELNCLD